MKILNLSIVLMLLAPAAWAAPAVIGKVERVRGPVECADETGAKRELKNGGDVYLRDVIETGSRGYVKIDLLDKTSLTAGASSRLVLDEFVYDADARSGKAAFSLARGLFRLVTGEIVKQNPENMKASLAVGDFGIRGTAVLAQTSADGSRVVLESRRQDAQLVRHVVVGGSEANGRRGETALENEGEACDVRPGQLPGQKFALGAKVLEAMQQALEPPLEDDVFDQVDKLNGSRSGRPGVQPRDMEGGQENDDSQPSHETRSGQ
ncbi:MAG TPA: hypothetical protein VL688_06900 [Verrucomicrobiae bacterium]|nr:hypothetical protein [Verrucomicrobiae bacterium]